MSGRVDWMAWLVVVAIGGAAWGQQVSPAPLTTEQTQERSLDGWSIDELIAALPRAGTEWRNNDGDGAYAPVCLELAARMATTRLTDGQWTQLLKGTRAIVVRDKWPVGEPFAVSMVVPDWLLLAQIRATPDVSGWSTAMAGEPHWMRCGMEAMAAEALASYQRLGEIGIGRRDVTFSVGIERGTARSLMRAPAVLHSMPSGVVWRGTMRYEIEGVATIDEAVPPADSARLTEAVKDAASAGVRGFWVDGELQPVWVVAIDADASEFPELRRVALSVRVELLRDGKVMHDAQIVARQQEWIVESGSLVDGSSHFSGWQRFEALPLEMAADAAELARWTARLTGTSEGVLRLWDAEERWGGTVEVSLAELVQREKARSGPEASDRE